MQSSTASSASDKTGAESLQEAIFELSLFLLTAARGCVDEPHMYGPLRLMNAINRLSGLYSKSNLLTPDQFLLKRSKEIEENIDKVMSSEDEFIAFMDKMIVEFTTEMKTRYSKEIRDEQKDFASRT
jgi:uncharacterized protein DUF6092